jgi:hypothetical protein
VPGAADASLGGLSIEVSSEKAAALAALAVVITHAASRCVQDDDVLAFFAARAEVAAAAAATAKAALPVERRAPGAVRSTLLAVRRLAQSVRVRVRVHAIRLVLDALADDGAESAGSGSFPECSANVPSSFSGDGAQSAGSGCETEPNEAADGGAIVGESPRRRAGRSGLRVQFDLGAIDAALHTAALLDDGASASGSPGCASAGGHRAHTARDAKFLTHAVPAVLRCIDADSSAAMARACAELPVEATVRVRRVDVVARTTARAAAPEQLQQLQVRCSFSFVLFPSILLF